MKVNKNRFLDILDNPWYALLAELQNLISYETYNYFNAQNLKTIHLPITTNTISSPMGLGSDSKPVKINLFGQETYLADSMQFMLEYGCRFFDKGAYYIMPSFRGESADQRHLCQFYHSEVEIPFKMDKAMIFAENYISYLSSKILEKLGDAILKNIGDITHLEILANNKERIPALSFDECCILLKNDPKFIKKDPRGFRTINHLGERELIDRFSGFVWLTHYDHLSVPFYQAYYDKER